MPGTRNRTPLMLLASLALLAGSPAEAQVVVVQDTLFDFFHAPFNPGCPGCGLLDWDDLYNSGYACRRLPGGQRGSLCGGLVNPPDPDWDDQTALSGSLEITGALPNRLVGLVTEFDDPDDPFPPYDPSASGAILSVSGTYAVRHTGSNGIANTIRAHLLIKQSGDFFLSDASVPVPTGSLGALGTWRRFGEDGGGSPIPYTASDFGKILPDETVDAGQHPDFSATGAPLFFGFAMDMSFNGVIPNPPGFLNRGFNVDDIEITVTAAPLPVPVLPKAAGALLCALLVITCAAAAWRTSEES